VRSAHCAFGLVAGDQRLLGRQHVVGVEIDDRRGMRIDLGQGRRIHRGVYRRDRAPDAEAAEDGLVRLLAADGTDIEATAHGGELVAGEVVGHLKIFDLHGRCS
jgi:hypothetical protein